MDTSKQIFRLHGVDEGKTVLDKKLGRKAVNRPSLHFTPVKSPEQRAIQMVIGLAHSRAPLAGEHGKQSHERYANWPSASDPIQTARLTLASKGPPT